MPGSVDGKEVSFAPSVIPGGIPPLAGNDDLIPWGCSIHLNQMSVVSKSRGIDAKLLVTTSNHILVNLADFAGMEEPDYDVWTSKRGKTYTTRSSKKTESSEKETTSSIHSVESSVAIRTEKVAACSCKRLISISS